MGFHGLQIGFPASLSTMGHRLCHLSETFRRPRNDVLLRCPCVHWRPVLRGLHQSVHTKNTRQVHRCLSICQTNVKKYIVDIYIYIYISELIYIKYRFIFIYVYMYDYIWQSNVWLCVTTIAWQDDRHMSVSVYNTYYAIYNIQYIYIYTPVLTPIHVNMSVSL
jgi:hypothetical protein